MQRTIQGERRASREREGGWVGSGTERATDGGQPSRSTGRGASGNPGALVVLAFALVAGVGGCVKLADSTAVGGATSALTREEHGMYFPIGLGSFHATQTCDDCHGGFSDFKQFTCQSCHPHDTAAAAGRHTFIVKFENNSAACYNCHPNGREAPITVADHSAKYFAIDAGPHAALQCADCHGWTTTSRPFTCQGCHAHDTDVLAAKHSAITGYRYDSNGCWGCHPNGGEAPIATSDHSAQFFPILTGSHVTSKCVDCHTDPTTSKKFVCITCHTQVKAAPQHPKTVANYAWNDAACYSCHPQDK
jgi:hypothetical protein